MQKNAKINERWDNHDWEALHQELEQHARTPGTEQRRSGVLQYGRRSPESREHADDGVEVGMQGLDKEIFLETDSSAARPFVARRGLRKMRHIEARYLWLQGEVLEKKCGCQR